MPQKLTQLGQGHNTDISLGNMDDQYGPLNNLFFLPIYYPKLSIQTQYFEQTNTKTINVSLNLFDDL